MPSKVRLQDIADRVGVSIATVSHALNGRYDQVSQETAREIIAVARELGYTGTALRRPFNTATPTVAVITSGLQSPTYMEALSGIEELASRFGFGMYVRRSGLQQGSPTAAVKAFLDRRVDGIIMIVSSQVNLPHDEFQAAVKSGIPVVVINQVLDPDKALHIVSQNEQGAYLATQHLISLGHRDIGCIHLPVSGPMAMQAGVERLAGYRRAMEDFGIPIVPEWIKEGSVGREAGFATGYAAMSELLRLDERPTAVVCGSDQLALGAVKRLREEGLDIPGDMAVMGFDNTPVAAHVHPGLSSVRQPMREAGQRAMEALVQFLWQGIELRGVEQLPCELVVRGSTTAHVIW